MEQMMLKRKHQDQNFISRAFQPLSSPHSGQNPTVSDRSSSEDEADTASNPLPSIYNVFYTSEDRGDMGLEPIMGVDTFFDTHHLSQVNIEELHELTAVPVVAIATHKTGTGGSQHAQKGDQLSTSLPKGGSKRKKDILRVDKEKICEPSAAVATIKEEYAHPREGRKEVLPVQNEGTRVQKKAETVAHPKARRPKGKKKVIKMPQRLTTTTTPLVEKQVPSVVPGIEESVKQAWSSKQQSFSHDLSSFFCSSDSHGQAGKREDPVAKESDSGQGLPVSILLPLTLPTSWVPGSSVSGNHSDNDQAQTESSLLHISHSDLPPPSTPTSTPTLDHDSADDSDNRSDGRLSPYITEDELEEAKEWAAADGCTLEKLAGELASTTTRDNYEKELEEDMGREVWSRMTTEQLAQEFEEYQNKVMDEDDFD